MALPFASAWKKCEHIFSELDSQLPFSKWKPKTEKLEVCFAANDCVPCLAAAFNMSALRADRVNNVDQKKLMNWMAGSQVKSLAIL